MKRRHKIVVEITTDTMMTTVEATKLAEEFLVCAGRHYVNRSTKHGFFIRSVKQWLRCLEEARRRRVRAFPATTSSWSYHDRPQD